MEGVLGNGYDIGKKTEKTQLLGYLMKEKTSFLCQNPLL